MSRSLTILLLALLLLSGCAMAPSSGTTDAAPAPTPSPVDSWLDLYAQVSIMDIPEVLDTLVKLQRPEGTDQLFYYGLLNQQLQTYGAWTQARDTFQKIQENEQLTPEQQQLASILRQYNQNRINWYVRQRDLLNQHAELDAQMAEAREENRQLQQKIQALTELETVISTRKEE